MRLNSIEAIEFGRGNRGQHLALNAAERGLAHHYRPIELHAGSHCRRVDAHDVHDVPHAPGALERRIKLGLQHAGGLRNGDLFDPGHSPIIIHGSGGSPICR